MADKNSEDDDSKAVKRTPLLEWISAAIGLVVVVGTLAFLIYSAATEDDSPPHLTVSSEKIVQTENGWLVKFTLYNDGENNAANVVVEGKILQGEKALETSSITVDYSPSHSKREGGLLFTNNPQNFEFQIRPLGFTKP